MIVIGHLLQIILLSLLLIETTNGYSVVVNPNRVSLITASTTTAPPRTDKKTGSTKDKNKKSDWISPSPTDNIAGKLEYLADDRSISRLADDPFHIMLLGETFSEERSSRITLNYVASSLEYVLGMPGNTALDHSNFAKENGLSCLGTWKREECLVLGSQLLVRDIVCRVVPYCDGAGGDVSGWQARDVTNSDIFQ